MTFGQLERLHVGVAEALPDLDDAVCRLGRDLVDVLVDLVEMDFSELFLDLVFGVLRISSRPQ